MPIADTKKFCTCTNLLYKRVTKPIADAAAVAALIRQAIIDNNLVSFLSEGELTALQTFVTNLNALAASPVVTKMAALHVPTHEDQAITITGVNDG